MIIPLTFYQQVGDGPPTEKHSCSPCQRQHQHSDWKSTAERFSCAKMLQQDTTSRALRGPNLFQKQMKLNQGMDVLSETRPTEDNCQRKEFPKET